MAFLRTDAAAVPRVLRWVEALAYSSVLAAGVAGALASAVSLAFEIPIEPVIVALASSGTLVVYNVDRLRDLERDRSLAPRRSAFVERNRRRLVALALLAAGSSVVCALQLTPAAWSLCGVVLALGLLHRRLKRLRGIKTIYLAGSWLAVVVGLPLVGTGQASWPGDERVYWVCAIVGCAIASNLMVSNLDRRHADEDPRHASNRSRLGLAIVVAGLGIGFALVSPQAQRGLVLIPACELVVFCRFREGERYGEVAVDGALLAGACGAVLALGLGLQGAFS